MAISIEDMAIFCKDKGFVYQNSLIYGGLAGFWDFGPLGVELKNNIKGSWWKRFVQSRDDIVGMDGSLITHGKIWEASGHVSCFADIVIHCSKCKHEERADHFLEEKLGKSFEGASAKEINDTIKKNKITCPKCKSAWNDAEDFNLMFGVMVGPKKEKSNLAYLRPETAQLIFANFKLIAENARMKLPFGIAQIGKAFRNEIAPRDFLFRSREFEQAEIEYFVHPEKIKDCPYFTKKIAGKKVMILTKDGKKAKTISFGDLAKLTTPWHAYWIYESYQWFLDLGIKKENLRLREHSENELAHYAGACFDIEYKFPFGWKEIHGNADRTTYDVSQHIKVSAKDLQIFDEESKQKIVPYVASEPSQGIDRAFLAFLFDAYVDDKKRGNIVLKLHPGLAPIQVGVFSLVNKLNKETFALYRELQNYFVCFFDKSGSIGRRYARADEIGIPYGITVDFDSLKDKAVTVRDRDTTKQVRVKIADLKQVLSGLLEGRISFDKAGKKV